MKSINLKLSRSVPTLSSLFRTYLQVYSALQPQKTRLNERQLDLLAVILSQDVHSNQFKGTALLRNAKTLGVQVNTINTYKRQLRLKGWLDIDHLPNKAMVSLQKAVLDSYKTDKDIALNVRIPIVLSTTNTLSIIGKDEERGNNQ